MLFCLPLKVVQVFGISSIVEYSSAVCEKVATVVFDDRVLVLTCLSEGPLELPGLNFC